MVTLSQRISHLSLAAMFGILSLLLFQPALQAQFTVLLFGKRFQASLVNSLLLSPLSMAVLMAVAALVGLVALGLLRSYLSAGISIEEKLAARWTISRFRQLRRLSVTSAVLLSLSIIAFLVNAVSGLYAMDPLARVWEYGGWLGNGFLAFLVTTTSLLLFAERFTVWSRRAGWITVWLATFMLSALLFEYAMWYQLNHRLWTGEDWQNSFGPGFPLFLLLTLLAFLMRGIFFAAALWVGARLATLPDSEAAGPKPAGRIMIGAYLLSASALLGLSLFHAPSLLLLLIQLRRSPVATVLIAIVLLATACWAMLHMRNAFGLWGERTFRPINPSPAYPVIAGAQYASAGASQTGAIDDLGGQLGWTTRLLLLAVIVLPSLGALGYLGRFGYLLAWPFAW